MADEMKGKFLLTRPGGGQKTEIRPNARGKGWLVMNFEYDEQGVRKRVDEQRGVSNAEVVELLGADPAFAELLTELAQELV